MKFPIAISALILATGAGLGWFEYQRLAAVRKIHRDLVAEAAAVGIAIDPAKPGNAILLANHERDTRDLGPKLTAAEFIAFALELEAFEASNGGRPDEAVHLRILDIMDRMRLLNAAQLKSLITEISTNKEIKEKTRQDLLDFSIMSVANDQPQTALALFSEFSKHFTDARVAGKILAASLARLAKNDPLAALEWVRANSEHYTTLITEDTKRGMILGAAVQYPKLAFKLADALDFKDASVAIQGIVSAAKSPEERTATLAALRQFTTTITDDTARNAASNIGVRVLFQGILQDGYDATNKWLTAANLTQSELETFADGVSAFTKSSDTGQWIEWLDAALPSDKADEKIRNCVSNWTQSDYQAAGKWLAALPDGPTKNSSVRAYAETVSRYEPDSAAQWAMTLPAGNDRDATLKTVYQNWQVRDPAAAAAFATQNGIK
jgi:hypothetical protein